jgi:hypothetical protein
MHTEQQQETDARKMLLRSDAILEAVDQAIKERGHKVRAMLTFRPEEISEKFSYREGLESSMRLKDFFSIRR